MPSQLPERRLAAILAADVVGYSRLIGLDEEGTLARIKAFRDNLMDRKIAAELGPNRKDDRRWASGRICECRRCLALRYRNSGGDGRA